MIGRGELKGAKLLTQSRKASWLIFWAIFLPPSLLAQTASSDPALIQQLFDRVNQLEMEVKELRSKVNKQKEIQPTPLLEPPASGENKDLASDEQQAPVHESKVGEAVPSTESAAPVISSIFQGTDTRESQKTERSSGKSSLKVIYWKDRLWSFPSSCWTPGADGWRPIWT